MTINAPERVHTQTLEHFFQGIESGRFTELTSEEIYGIVDTIYLKYDALIPLTESEFEKVRENIFQELKKWLNNNLLKQMAELPLVAYTREEMRRQSHAYKIFLFNPDNQTDVDGNEILQTHPKETMTVQEKIALFSNRELFDDIWFQNGPLFRYGQRPLWGYHNALEEVLDIPDIFNGEKCVKTPEFVLSVRNLLQHLRARTGHDILHIADIGGANGRALYDLKEIDPDIVTHNVTLEEQPAMYPVDHLYLNPAERLPADFREKMDLVISNIAFRYFLYPEIAYKNVLQSLAIGGESFISFGSDRSPLLKTSEGRRELQQRILDFNSYRDALHSSGIIEQAENSNRVIKHASIPE